MLTSTTFPYTRYLDLKGATSSFSQYAAFAQLTWAVGTGDAAHEQPIAAVSASFFDFFDARPALGRFFDATEDVVPRGAAVAVLDHGFWERELGAKNVIGQSLTDRYDRVHDRRGRTQGIRRRRDRSPSGGVRPDHDGRGE